MPWWSCRWRLPDKMAISQTPKYLVNACSTASGFSEWVAHFMYNFIHLSIAVEMWKHIRTFTFKCQHSLAPPYLSNQLQQVARMEPRQRLRSSSSPALVVPATSSSRMRVIYHNWSATKQRPHPQSVAEISHHSVLSGDRIRHPVESCETSSGSRHKDTDQCL